MQKTTVIVGQNGNPFFSAPQLVVAVQDANGNIDATSVQPLSEWNSGQRDLNLITRVKGAELLDILTNELGLVGVDEEGLLQHRMVLTTDPHVSVMRVLGKIAEALIVRECNQSEAANRNWAMYARRGNRPHPALDRYKAVGTGLHSTNRLYPTKYRPTDTQRDIIWVNVDDVVAELIEKRQVGSSAGVPAGLQIKVSCDGLAYIYKTDVRRGKYEIPLVYFDLENDYYKLTDAIYKEERDNVRIGIDIIRGRDISAECHDWLKSYYWAVHALVTGRLSVDQLVKDALLFDAFKKDIQEQSRGNDLIVL